MIITYAYLYIILIAYINAFNIRLRTIETLITSKAVLSSFISKIDTELVTNDALTNDIIKFQGEDIIYILLFAGSLYYKSENIENNKLNKINTYVYTKRRTNTILLIFTLVLSKNIENAI